MSCKCKFAMLQFPESSLDLRRIQFNIQFGVTGAVNVKFTLRLRLISFSALVAYEYLLTFYDEVKAIWRRKLTGASVLVKYCELIRVDNHDRSTNPSFK